MDGRDIGTVVLPDADVKIFLTASAEARAQRRYKEQVERGEDVTFEQVLAAIQKRDEADSSRATAPLKAAEDAVVVDTTVLNLEESIAVILGIIKEKLHG
jgi:cytidylate kinase